ncbi:hypothetical protein [Psychrobacillus sp. FSL K6-2843]|jgi:peptide methionine sulfoxide reductase MsrB|uniref:hypothetical protein n=1 Tax=Psychrobacillus sp. FSL K6-2843 TaxID=2921549 RepID=UPI00315A7E7B
MNRPSAYITEICPSCHPTDHVKTLARFTGEYDEKTNEYIYECVGCHSKVWANEQWIKDNAVD